MTEDLPTIPERVQGQAALERLQPQIGTHKEYTYRVFQDFDFGATDLTQSIFTGSLWRKIRATQTCFRRCDFDGMQVEQCVFTDADFTNADIRSTAFARCRFLRCRFDGALIDTCSFDQCVIDRCSFDSVAQRACRFFDCDLLGYSLARSSFTKCRIDQSRMHGLMLADCTFLYVILRSCELRDVTVNVESLGTIFGITREDLSHLTFIHLGQEALPLEENDLASLLEDTYKKQHWTLSLATTRLNFSLTSSAFAIADYLRDTEAQMRLGRRLRHEEIAFLLEIFGALLEDGRLPLVSLSQLGNVLQRVQSLAGKATADKQLSRETVELLTAKISALAQATLDDLAGAIGKLDLHDERLVSIACHYEEAPRLNIPSLMAEATLAAGLPLNHPPVRTAVRPGSYVEVIQASLATAFSFQILLYALNGILIQLIEMKQRIRVLRQRRAPRKFELLARSDQQALPAALRLPIRRLVEFASSGGWMQKPDLDGIDSGNVHKIEIEALSQSQGDDRASSSPPEIV